MSEVKLSNKLYELAEEPSKIVNMLIESTKFPEFDHLKFAKIKCLYKDNLEGHGWNKLGKVLKVNDLYWSLLNLDIIVIINEAVWDKLATENKIALTSHLMSKVKVYWRYESKKKRTLKSPENNEIASFDVTYTGRINYTIVPPDIEEFEVVASKFPKSYERLKKISHESEEMMKRTAYLINFDKELPDDIVKQIRDAYKEIDELKIINKQVSIKLHKQLYVQCVDIRQQLESEYPDIFSGGNPIIVNPPGFAIAAIYLTNEIEAKLKVKPFILELIKDKDPGSLFGRFKFRRILDLEYNKNVTRTKTREPENQDNQK